MIRYRNLTVRGCGQVILRDFELALPDRGTAVLLGPSGCGKTTLLRSTIREDEDDPDLEVSGTIELNGTDLRARSVSRTAVRQRIGLIPQRPVAFPGTTFENVTFALKHTTRLTRAEIERRARISLEEVGLEEALYEREADCLSGGQLKRLAIARTVALEPDVLLMDEPSNGLDPLAVVRLERLISRLAEQRLVTVVTHDLYMTRRIADEVHFLWPFADGCRVVESGAPEKVLEVPARPETRLFVQAAWEGAAALYEVGDELEDCEAEECMPRRMTLHAPETRQTPLDR
jgi:ABC-type phosphate transport system ATPase subunit